MAANANGTCDDCKGPGYATPKDSMILAPREKLVYLPCIQVQSGKRDYLATIDVDPNSKDYCKVIHRLYMQHDNDELHHSGWNTCASCYGNPLAKRDKLILPSLGSSRIYIIDTSVEKVPKIHAVIEPEEMKALGVTRPHTAHCTADGDVIVSTMGDVNDSNQGSLIVLDGKTWKLKGKWADKDTKYAYDFWYQYKHNVLISSAWGKPSTYWKGLDTSLLKTDYGCDLHVYDFKNRKYLYNMELGDEGRIPLEVRFLHDPESAVGFVCCAYSSTVFRFAKNAMGIWEAKKVIQVEPKEVEGWVDELMPGVISDIVLSMDDKYLYLPNWIQGDIRQYDISDTHNPRLVGRLFLGGSMTTDSKVKVVNPLEPQPQPLYIKGRKMYGGPQMMQLSLDGKRLYLTDSLITPWDKQLYPEMARNGSLMLQIDVDTEKGGLTLNENFLVDFGKEPEGPVVAHEIRYPGGDCTSDIYLPADMLPKADKS